MNKPLTGILAVTALAGAADIQAYDWQSAKENLSAKRQHIAAAAALAAAGNLPALEKAFDQGFEHGLAINEYKELVLQLYAYTGFPRCLNASETLENVVNARQAAGKEDLFGPVPQPLTGHADKYEIGKKNLEILAASPLPSHPKAFIQDTDTFLKEHLFADIFARGVLTYQEREVGTVAALAALGNVTPQLKAHIGLAMNVGVTPKEVAGILAIVKENIGRKEAADGLKALNEVVAARTQTSQTVSGENKMEQAPIDTVFAQGEVNPYGKYFTGTTYLTMLSGRDNTFNAPIGNVTFEPGARTNWHKHDGGQILLVLNGEGRYQEKDGEIRTLKKGDVVRIAPGVIHWHGAAPTSWFVHISVETNAHQNGTTTWLESVTDKEYK